MMSNMTSLL